jgi:hypothetical protein
MVIYIGGCEFRENVPSYKNGLEGIKRRTGWNVDLHWLLRHHSALRAVRHRRTSVEADASFKLQSLCTQERHRSALTSYVDHDTKLAGQPR